MFIRYKRTFSDPLEDHLSSDDAKRQNNGELGRQGDGEGGEQIEGVGGGSLYICCIRRRSNVLTSFLCSFPSLVWRVAALCWTCLLKMTREYKLYGKSCFRFLKQSVWTGASGMKSCVHPSLLLKACKWTVQWRRPKAVQSDPTMWRARTPCDSLLSAACMPECVCLWWLYVGTQEWSLSISVCFVAGNC